MVGKAERNKIEKKARIIDVARSAFLAEEFDDVRMADIARSAGIAKGTLFLYAATKEELFFIVFQEKLEAVVFGSLEPDPHLTLRQALARHHQESLAFFSANPVFGRKVLKALGWTSPISRQVLNFAVDYENKLSALISDHQSRGAPSPLISANFMARFIVDIFFAIIRRWWLGMISFEELENELKNDMDFLVSAFENGRAVSSSLEQ